MSCLHCGCHKKPQPIHCFNISDKVVRRTVKLKLNEDSLCNFFVELRLLDVAAVRFFYDAM